MKFVRHNTHSRKKEKKKGSARGNLCRRQIQNTCPATERERERGREAADIRGSNQFFIYCLLLVCFSFHCVSFRVISHCEGRDPVTVTVTTLVTAQTGNNFISKIASFYAYYPWSLSSSHCQFQLHTASVSIVLISAANLPIVQSTIRLCSSPCPHRRLAQWVIRVCSLFGRKTITELRAIVRSRRREITFVSFIYPAIFIQLGKRAKFSREFPTK